MPSWLANTLRIILMLALPFCLVLTNVRLMLTPFYINWEYNLSDFPPDPYGFTKEDRLKYSALALDYLLNNAGIEFLGDLKLPPERVANAEIGDRMYNDRELKHMLDVKIVVGWALRVWVVSTVLTIGSIVALAWRPETHPLLRSGLLSGAAITAVSLAVTLLVVVFAFGPFFVFFHRIFFEGESWLFNWYDTLIRLFPTKFWQDVFIWIGGGAILEAALIGAIAWWGLRGK